MWKSLCLASAFSLATFAASAVPVTVDFEIPVLPKSASADGQFELVRFVPLKVRHSGRLGFDPAAAAAAALKDPGFGLKFSDVVLRFRFGETVDAGADAGAVRGERPLHLGLLPLGEGKPLFGSVLLANYPGGRLGLGGMPFGVVDRGGNVPGRTDLPGPLGLAQPDRVGTARGATVPLVYRDRGDRTASGGCGDLCRARASSGGRSGGGASAPLQAPSQSVPELTPVPLPAGGLLLLTGLIGLGALCRRRARAA